MRREERTLSEVMAMPDEPMVLKGNITAPYNWTTGQAAGRFLTEFKENRRIIGAKCADCGVVFVPPQEFCRTCLKMMEFVPVSDAGTLTGFTVVETKPPDNPFSLGDPPYVIAAVRLEGADTDFIHLIRKGVAPSSLKPGMRVRAVWKEERKGNLLDIEGFEPAPEAAAVISDQPILEPKIREVKGKVSVPYNWAYGENITKFFKETRDNKRIMGTRCSKCRKVLVPPVALCGRCFAMTEEKWVELPDTATLVAHTVVYLPFPGQPQEPPYAYGMLRFDGADTQFPHLIGGIEFDKIKCGMRLKAVWNEERKGDLFDIKYFEPLRE
ncbi:MAG: Zn-ribbon domain-containing OB-fold protein [bacterium]